MALHTALRRKNGGCRAVFAVSGTMVAPQLLEKEIISKPPICFVHGKEDKIVPVSLGKISYEYALKNGIKAEFNAMEGLEHFIDFNAMQKITSFIKSLQ